ncbi:hypothetical protein FocTR4_00000027 [Fusarium oxysporum f. sp. cubense]|uniref:Uncharacterized protein n=1 Tax=Fusarium oxysporum f. sp. cubense TaxID=61366 RepID=A0A5C6SYR3_FUSOC|nr:hypothetical protein FocTR4_00000027 [Fusarium oxysporum f. sp. cubense]
MSTRSHEITILVPQGGPPQSAQSTLPRPSQRIRGGALQVVQPQSLKLCAKTYEPSIPIDWNRTLMLSLNSTVKVSIPLSKTPSSDQRHRTISSLWVSHSSSMCP